MAKQSTKSAKSKGWDSEENEAQSINFKFGRFADDDYKGDRILGVLLSKRQVPNRLSSKPGAMQWVYETKVREGEYHNLDKKRNFVEPSIELEAGDIVSIYGKPFFDNKMRGVKVGQVFGLKYIGDLEAKVEGHNDTKEIKVYLPKNDEGEFEMDQEVLDSQGATFDDFADKKEDD